LRPAVSSVDRCLTAGFTGKTTGVTEGTEQMPLVTILTWHPFDEQTNGADMSLAHWVYVSSYIDEYGTRLPELIDRFVNKHSGKRLKLMTLFAHGTVMQLLEGEVSVLSRAVQSLTTDAAQFGLITLLKESVEESCLQASSVGMAKNSIPLTRPGNPYLDLFRLHPTEVEGRLTNCVASRLMMGFVETHQ
jgi:hypothetical protein